MINMPERWDCLYIGRIDSKRRIFLKSPQEYGFMYLSRNQIHNSKTKVRKSIPKDCGKIFGQSNRDKILKAIAIAVSFNRRNLKGSKGLVLREHSCRTTHLGLQTILLKCKGKALREKGTTDWLIYISPEKEFYYLYGRYILESLLIEDIALINSCIKEIEEDWLK